MMMGNTQTKVYLPAPPSLNTLRLFQIVDHRTNGPHLGIPFHRLDKGTHGVRMGDGVGIQQPEVIRTLFQSVTDAHIAATAKAQIAPGFQHRYRKSKVGNRCPNAGDTVVSGAVVNDNDLWSYAPQISQ